MKNNLKQPWPWLLLLVVLTIGAAGINSLNRFPEWRGNPTVGYVWTCTNSTTGEGQWSPAGGIMGISITNGEQTLSLTGSGSDKFVWTYDSSQLAVWTFSGWAFATPIVLPLVGRNKLLGTDSSTNISEAVVDATQFGNGNPLVIASNATFTNLNLFTTTADPVNVTAISGEQARFILSQPSASGLSSMRWMFGGVDGWTVDVSTNAWTLTHPGGTFTYSFVRDAGTLQYGNFDIYGKSLTVTNNFANLYTAEMVATNSTVNSNLTVNFASGVRELFLTNNISLTNFTGQTAGRVAATQWRVTPVAVNRNVVYPTLAGNSFGIHFSTNANNAAWLILTNGKSYRMTFQSWGTNIDYVISEWN